MTKSNSVGRREVRGLAELASLAQTETGVRGRCRLFLTGTRIGRHEETGRNRRGDARVLSGPPRIPNVDFCVSRDDGGRGCLVIKNLYFSNNVRTCGLSTGLMI